MRAFRFPLERVRQWRRTQLEMEQLALQRLFAERDALHRAEADLYAERRHAETSLLSEGSMEAGQLAALEEFRRYVRSRLQRLEEQQRELAQRIDEQRARVLLSRRRLELLEKLKSGALERWRRRLDRELDELASEAHIARWKTPLDPASPDDAPC